MSTARLLKDTCIAKYAYEARTGYTNLDAVTARSEGAEDIDVGVSR